jgi:AGZA family xanthine/uracil permease-like MFS transporter
VSAVPVKWPLTYNPRVLQRYFRLRERDTTVRREVLGGATTFATMAYIIVVNPAILGFAGFPVGPSTIATILTAVFGTLLMGLYANRPIAVAPYMGENAFLAFGLAALGVSWPQRLGVVFLSGLLFLGLTLVGLRSRLAEAISPSLKHAFGAGIGLFLALIGLYEMGVVTSAVAGTPAAALTEANGLLRAPAVPLKIGNLHDPRVLLGLAGFVAMSVLMLRRVKGALLLGMAGTALLGILLGFGRAPEAVVAMPFTGEWSLAPLFLKLDVAGALRPELAPAVLTLLLMGLLDTLGTLVAVGAAAGLLDEKGNLPEMQKPMVVDALTCSFAALVGTSTSGAYIESAAGIREGARTGLSAIVTALLFALSLFFIPLLAPMQELRFAYAPALVAVGLLMTVSLARVDHEDLTEVLPAFAAVAFMVFTYNIANGVTAGLVLHPVLKLAAGRGNEVPAGAWVLGALCAAYLAFGLPH